MPAHTACRRLAGNLGATEQFPAAPRCHQDIVHCGRDRHHAFRRWPTRCVHRLPFRLHYFAQAGSIWLCRGSIRRDAFEPHIGLGPNRLQPAERTSGRLPARYAYISAGPTHVEAGRRIASERGWPEDAAFRVFQEYQQDRRHSSFEVALARSAVTLKVPAGRPSSK